MTDSFCFRFKSLFCLSGRSRRIYDIDDVGEVTEYQHNGLGGALEIIQDNYLRNVVIDEALRLQNTNVNPLLVPESPENRVSGGRRGFKAISALSNMSDQTPNSRNSTLLTAANPALSNLQLTEGTTSELEKIKDKFKSTSVVEMTERERDSFEVEQFFRTLDKKAVEARKMVQRASNGKSKIFSVMSGSTSMINYTGNDSIKGIKSPRHKLPERKHRSTYLGNRKKHRGRKAFVSKKPFVVASQDLRNYNGGSEAEKAEYLDPPPRPIRVASIDLSKKKNKKKLSMKQVDLKTFGERSDNDLTDVLSSEIYKGKGKKSKRKERIVRRKKPKKEVPSSDKSERPMGVLSLLEGKGNNRVSTTTKATHDTKFFDDFAETESKGLTRLFEDNESALTKE